jgi:hypothetical protein
VQSGGGALHGGCIRVVVEQVSVVRATSSVQPQRIGAEREPRERVCYGSSSPDAALGELFQAERVIDRDRNSPYLTALALTQRLTVLDVAADSAGAGSPTSAAPSPP